MARAKPGDGARPPIAATRSRVNILGPTVAVIRHGRTSLNTGGLTRGHIDAPLHPDAFARVKATGKRLSKIPLQKIYSSDLSRANDTAKGVAQGLAGGGGAGGAPGGPIPILTDEALRPWNIGVLSGHPTEEALPTMLNHMLNKPDQPVLGGESFHDYENRFLPKIKSILDEAQSTASRGGIGVVTHDRNIRSILAHIDHLNGTPSPVDLKPLLEGESPLEPGGFMILHHDGQKWNIHFPEGDKREKSSIRSKDSTASISPVVGPKPDRKERGQDRTRPTAGETVRPY